MMNPSETQKLWEWAPLPILITVILLLAPKFIIDPQIDNFTEADLAIGRTLTAMRESLAARRNDSLRQQRLEQINVQMTRLNRWLPREEFLPSLIEQCDRLATLYGVRMSSVNYKFQEKNGKALPGFTLTFNLNGEYAPVRGFIQALEGLPSPLFLIEVVAKRDRTYTLTVTQLVKS